MLRPAPIVGRCMRDEAALCQTYGSRRASRASSGGPPGAQGARARLPTDGLGHARRHARRPDAVSFARISGDRALLLQSDGWSDLYGIGSGSRRVHGASFVRRVSCSSILAFYFCVLVGTAADARAAAARTAAASMAAAAGQQGITIEKIMSDPDWIGAAVKDAY